MRSIAAGGIAKFSFLATALTISPRSITPATVPAGESTLRRLRLSSSKLLITSTKGVISSTVGISDKGRTIVSNVSVSQRLRSTKFKSSIFTSPR